MLNQDLEAHDSVVASTAAWPAGSTVAGGARALAEPGGTIGRGYWRESMQR